MKNIFDIFPHNDDCIHEYNYETIVFFKCEDRYENVSNYQRTNIFLPSSL